MNFDERVYKQELRLNDTDESIVKFIKENRENIYNTSIHKLAKDMFVSPNAIMRTAKKLGYSGFAELKFSLQKEATSTENEDYGTVESKIMSKLPSCIVKTLDVMDDRVLNEIIRMMISSRKILIVGAEEFVHYCAVLGRYLRCLEKSVDYFNRLDEVGFTIKHLDERDLVIFMCNAEPDEKVAAYAKYAKESKIKSVCISNYGENEVSILCDRHICYWGAKKIENGYNITDRTGLMMLIRIMCENYWLKICM